MVNKQIVKKIEVYLQLLKQDGLEIPNAVLFGSWSRGDARLESDIDLALISPLFDGPTDKYMAKIWKNTKASGYQIEPIAIGEQQFENDHVSPLLEMIRREGIDFTKLVAEPLDKL